MKGKVQLALLLPLVTACSPRFIRGSAAHCTKQFLYTEYSTGRGGTLETHPVYGCVAPSQAITPRQPSGS